MSTPIQEDYIHDIEVALEHLTSADQVAVRLPGVSFPIPNSFDNDEVWGIQEHFHRKGWNTIIGETNYKAHIERNRRWLIFKTSAHVFPSKYEG